MKTMKTTVNSSAKTGRISATATLVAEFSSSARELAKKGLDKFFSPLEEVKLNASAGAHWVSTSPYDEEEKELNWCGGCLTASSDGLYYDEALCFDAEGNLYTTKGKVLWVYAKKEVKTQASLKAVAKGLFEVLKEAILLHLVQDGAISYNEMSARFRKEQGYWEHCNKLPKDLCKELANLAKKVSMVGTSEGRKAYKRLCVLKKEYLG